MCLVVPYYLGMIGFRSALGCHNPQIFKFRVVNAWWELGVVVNTNNPNTQEAKAGR